MKKEEHKQILTQIQHAKTDVDRMALLMQLETDYGQVITERDNAVTERTTVTTERDKYAKLNNELFLQNSAQTADGQAVDSANVQNKDNDEHESQLTYEDLGAKFEADYKEEQ